MSGGVYGLRRLGEPRLRRLIVLTVAAILVGYRLLQFAVFTTQVQWGYDFSASWAAAGRILAGEPLYAATQLAGPYAPQYQFLYLYPPPLAAFAIAFHQPWSLWNLIAPGDYRAAAWAWTAMGTAILVGTIFAVAHVEGLVARVRGAIRLGPWILVAAAIGFPPVVGELVLGNVHLLLLGLFGLAWIGIRRGDTWGERTAGAAIGVAAIIKVFPGLLLLWFLLTRRWQGALWVVLGAGVVTLVTLPFTGLSAWFDYPTVLANLSAPADTKDTLAPTVWLAPVVGFTVARVVVTVVGLALLAWAALRLPARASFTVAVLVSILVAPALYHHYLAITVLPFLLLLADGVGIGWLGLAYILMSGGDQPALGEWAWVVNRAMPTLGALLLLALALVPRARRGGLTPDVSTASGPVASPSPSPSPSPAPSPGAVPRAVSGSRNER